LAAIKFDKKYDSTILAAELNSVFNDEWINHFNTKDFNGKWKSIALRSATGNADDIIANYTPVFKDTPLLAKLPYINIILQEWKCEKETVRFMALYPDSEIKPHRDLGCSYTEGNFRLHIPILTNEAVDFVVDGINHKLQPGDCWYMDFSKVHSVKNAGETVRVHLVIDCLRNQWSDELFSEFGYVEEGKRMPVEQVKEMIAQLESHQTETAENLIAQLKQQYGLS
jgi:hypothetical protein